MGLGDDCSGRWSFKSDCLDLHPFLALLHLLKTGVPCRAWEVAAVLWWVQQFYLYPLLPSLVSVGAEGCAGITRSCSLYIAQKGKVGFALRRQVAATSLTHSGSSQSQREGAPGPRANDAIVQVTSINQEVIAIKPGDQLIPTRKRNKPKITSARIQPPHTALKLKIYIVKYGQFKVPCINYC